jgi:hypothetical protein
VLAQRIIFGHGQTTNSGVAAIAVRCGIAVFVPCSLLQLAALACSTQVHPRKTHFAVAEKGIEPNIYVFEYPSFRVVRILRKGTERAYSDMQVCQPASSVFEATFCSLMLLLVLSDYSSVTRATSSRVSAVSQVRSASRCSNLRLLKQPH